MLTLSGGSSHKIKTLIAAHKSLTIVLTVPFLVTAYLLVSPKVAAAATITVNNNGDIEANDGACTLREAIISANNDNASGAAVGECNAGSGADTINFNITGVADFINDTKNGYTIAPTSALPLITEPVTINGYSQPDALANTAVAPNPLNGRLLIEISGLNAGSGASGFVLINNSDGSTFKGLVINNFSDGHGITIDTDEVNVQGNYIGTDPTGSTAHPNIVGVNGGGHAATVGGLNPADRNLISGNTAGSYGTASYPDTGWVFQGNYLGVAADGLTPIANSFNGGSGVLSIDNCSDVIVGGNQTGAINVIGASLGHGIAPDTADNVTIEGNYIGLGYDGTTVLGNTTVASSGSGLSVSNLTNSTIKNNRVAGWKSGGISINDGNSNLLIEGNTVFTNLTSGISAFSGVTGTSDITLSSNNSHDNNSDGIYVSDVSNMTIENNTVDSNGSNGINVTASDGAKISGNTVTNSASADGIVIQDSQDTVVENNAVSLSSSNGINLSNSNGANLSGNSISSNDDNGIYLNSSIDVVLNDETVTENVSIGIGIDGGSDNTSIIDSTVNNNTLAGISSNSSGTIIDSTEMSLNGQYGVLISDTTGAAIADSVVNNNQLDGINLSNVADSEITNSSSMNNAEDGLSIIGGSNAILVEDNQLSDNSKNGLNLTDESSDITAVKNTITDNTQQGIAIIKASSIQIGDPNRGNTISNNGINNIYIVASTIFGYITQNVMVQSNRVEHSGNGVGILVGGDVNNVLVGGSGVGQGNIVTRNNQAGIVIGENSVPAFPLYITPQKVSVLGNSIFSNDVSSGLFASGLGIDLMQAIDSEPDGNPDASADVGPTPNDPSDSDTGPNNFMNSPVINSAKQNLLNLNVNLDLDAADSPTNQYRVEFFANDTADPSGNGEGQTYLGAATVTPGTNKTATVTLPNNTNLTNKILSATTTAIDNTTDSGFGATSEFSEVSDVRIIALPGGSPTVGVPNTGIEKYWLFRVKD